MEDNIPIDKTCINILNDDCIIEIFLLLPIADRIRNERVCKRWQHLGKESWKEVRILDIKRSTLGLPEECNTYNLDIVKHVLIRCGNFLKQLNVLQWPLNSDHKPMAVICEYCPNLQCINLIGFDKFWLSTSDIRSLRNNYPNLNKLIMTDVKLECEAHLSQLFSVTKKLKYLSIGGLVGHTDLNGKCLQYLPHDAIEEIHLIRWGNLKPHFLNIALKKFNRLRALEMFPFNRFDASTLEIIGQKRTITDLRLFNTPSSVVSSMNHLLNLRNLERLCLRRNSMINDNFLINVSNNLKQLKYLNISSCKQVTDVGISSLVTLKNLQVLIANRLDKVTNEPFGDFFSLKVLKCARCENIIDPGIKKLISLAPNLMTLDLFRCSITNETIERAIEITKHRTNNTILEINIHKTKVDMSTIAETSPYLRIVDTRPTDYYYYEVNEEFNTIDIMSDGNDVATGENEIDSHSSMHPEPGDSSNNNNNNNNINNINNSNNNNNRDDEQMDGDNEAASNTNYDSGDGAVPVFRCDRCDNYETINKTAFCAHQDQCLAGNEGGESVEGNENNDHDGDNDEGSHSGGHRSHRKMFECDVCNMKFSNGANMRRHKMRHTGVKPYECRVCQKRFFRKDHLAEHFTTHSKTLPYHCPICNRGFQRQIAMRAHFQNEHVGQHDMVKSCPLCNYRAATMKCLRLHFFNRHGIDLDNPGPNSSSSLMNSCSPGEAMPSAPLSDSGDSTGNRSADNATPPMHFLTPHVEISIPYTNDQSSSLHQRNQSPAPLNGDSPNSPQSADSNSNAPSSSHHHHHHHHHQLSINSTVHRVGGGEETITPSISLIPIKQEPNTNGMDENMSSVGSGGVGSATSSNLPLPSLIKVSPLKSLLRDDLRRKLSNTTISSHNSINNNPNNNNINNNINNNNNTIGLRGEPPTSTRPDPRSGLQCTYCRITFPDQTLYFLHKGCHSESNPWKCNICGEQCCNLYQFNSHLLSKSHQ